MSKKSTETPHQHPRPHPHPHPEPATEGESILQPIMDDLKGKTSTQLPTDDEVAPPRGPLHPPQPAELDQDPGSGYNPDGTDPQT